MKKMKSKNKILAVTAFAMLSLMGCNIDPILTDSYSEDVAWSNVDNLRLNLNGFYSLIGGYYGSEVLSASKISSIMEKEGGNIFSFTGNFMISSS